LLFFFTWIAPRTHKIVIFTTYYTRSQRIGLHRCSCLCSCLRWQKHRLFCFPLCDIPRGTKLHCYCCCSLANDIEPLSFSITPSYVNGTKTCC